MVDHRTFNPRVLGSNPNTQRTKTHEYLLSCKGLLAAHVHRTTSCLNESESFIVAQNYFSLHTQHERVRT